MRFYLKLPGGGRLVFRKEPMSEERFKALCRLAGFGLYVVLTHVVAEQNGLLWLFILTLVILAIWAWKK